MILSMEWTDNRVQEKTHNKFINMQICTRAIHKFWNPEGQMFEASIAFWAPEIEA
jgi:hypothetical protein